MSDSAKELAEAILKSAELRENSFNHEAFKIARAAREAENAAMKNPFGCYGPDPEQFYGLDLRQSSELANAALAEPVYLLLFTAWNDAILWARTTLNLPIEVSDENA